MNVKNSFTFILLLATLMFSIEVHSHARLKTDSVTPPRNNNPGLKTGPCGGVARTATPAILTGGDTIELKWEETIQHPGRYEFSISLANDQSFIQLLIVPDNQDTNNDLPHQYTALLTIPNISCTDCTLQMIQVMTENPANPRNYYSCADINIVSAVTPTPTPIITPTPTPIITPTPTPPVTPTPSPAEVEAFRVTVYDTMLRNPATAKCLNCHRANATVVSVMPYFSDDDVSVAYSIVQSGNFINLTVPSLSLFVSKIAQGHNSWSGNSITDAVAMQTAIQNMVDLLNPPVVTPTPIITPPPTPTPIITPPPTPTPIITPPPTPVVTATPTPVVTVIPTVNPDPPSINSPDPDDVCNTN